MSSKGSAIMGNNYSPTLNGVDAVDTQLSEKETNLTAALEYASRGWRVFPLTYITEFGGCSCRQGIHCDWRGKHPIYVKDYLEHGLKEATCDHATIREWWRRWPNANIGIATGAESGLLVLDNDAYKGGSETLEAWTAEHGELPQTVEVQTGGGGVHYYFKYPRDGVRYGNKTYDPKKTNWPYVGIDIRGEGGYVVAPPSNHHSRGTYLFEASSDPPTTPLADAPTWLLRILSNGDAPKQTGDAVNTADAVGAREVKVSDRKHLAHLKQRAAAYLAAVPTAVEGQGGDDHTFQVAGHLLSLDCGGERLTIDEVMEVMGDWNSRCSPPWDLRDLEVKVRSAANNGTPRAIKPCKSGCGDDVMKDWADGARGRLGEATYVTTDSGNAEMFAAVYRDDMRYVSEWKRWIIWDGKKWTLDNKLVAMVKAMELVRFVMPTYAQTIADDDARAKYHRHIASSQNKGRIDAMLGLAAGKMAVSVNDLDANADLFNCQNGTIDCRTGQLRPHDREDFITKISPCSYDETASAPIWRKFIERIMQDESGQVKGELVEFLQTAVGYSLTGSIAEQCLFVLYGGGANGKSTFIDAILHCMGDYGQTMQPSVLLSTNRDSGNGEDVARLRGVRFAAAVETREGGSFNEEKIKRLTGDKRISARRLYENSIECEITHKIWLATNHKPNVKNNDDAIWRRLKRVPFLAKISDAEKDTTLTDKLRAEAEGILAWAMVGLKRWLTQGLQTPNEVKAATDAWREECDLFGQFLSSECVVDASAEVKSSQLYSVYKSWAEDNGIDFTMTAMTMAKKLEERGFKRKSKTDGRYWVGIGLRAEQDSKVMASATVDDRPF